MKYLKTYNKVNEGLRDKMKPKLEEEDIINKIKHLHPDEKLMFGVKEGIIKIVELAIKEGANLGRRGLLDKIIRSNNIDMIELLLDNYYDDIDININQLQSPLIYMVLTDNLEMIKFLEKYNLVLLEQFATYDIISKCIDKGVSKETITYLYDNYAFVRKYIESEILKLKNQIKKWQEYER